MATSVLENWIRLSHKWATGNPPKMQRKISTWIETMHEIQNIGLCRKYKSVVLLHHCPCHRKMSNDGSMKKPQVVCVFHSLVYSPYNPNLPSYPRWREFTSGSLIAWMNSLWVKLYKYCFVPLVFMQLPNNSSIRAKKYVTIYTTSCTILDTGLVTARSTISPHGYWCYSLHAILWRLYGRSRPIKLHMSLPTVACRLSINRPHQVEKLIWGWAGSGTGWGTILVGAASMGSRASDHGLKHLLWQNESMPPKELG